MKPEERQQALDNIAAEIAACTKCPLHAGRIQTVPGDGAMNASIMFIGEAPGQSEDEQGLPFVGRSGKYLEELLHMIGLSRQQVFIANVIKCRPPDNRDPLPTEIDTCKSYLDRQIEVIDPVIIATLGRFSMARYFPDGQISKIHGKPKYEGGRIYYPLFHPAAVLRNPNLRPVMADDFKRMLTLIEQAKNGDVPKDEPPPDDTPKQLSLF
jgi:uracil-DNA glycosylase